MLFFSGLSSYGVNSNLQGLRRSVKRGGIGGSNERNNEKVIEDSSRPQNCAGENISPTKRSFSNSLDARIAHKQTSRKRFSFYVSSRKRFARAADIERLEIWASKCATCAATHGKIHFAFGLPLRVVAHNSSAANMRAPDKSVRVNSEAVWKFLALGIELYERATI